MDPDGALTREMLERRSILKHLASLTVPKFVRCIEINYKGVLYPVYFAQLQRMPYLVPDRVARAFAEFRRSMAECETLKDRANCFIYGCTASLMTMWLQRWLQQQRTTGNRIR